jgi:hypothetical protein
MPDRGLDIEEERLGWFHASTRLNDVTERPSTVVLALKEIEQSPLAMHGSNGHNVFQEQMIEGLESSVV